MVGRAQAQAAKAALKQAAPKKTFTMQRLWRMILWGSAAAAALLIAALTTRTDVGSRRMAMMFSSLSGNSETRPGQATAQIAARPFDAQAETRRLSEAVRGLAAANDELKSRLAAVEHNVDDITGSIAQQIEALKTPTASPWPAAASSEPATLADIASVVAPTMQTPTGLAARLPPSPLTPAPSPADVAPPAGHVTEYGVDLGGALSVQALRARWLGIRSAHPQLFEGLAPAATLRQIPRSHEVELRLIVGPLADAETAAKLCTSLAPFRLFCQPTVFDRRHLALQ